MSDNGIKVVAASTMMVKGGDGSIDSEGSWKLLTYWEGVGVMVVEGEVLVAMVDGVISIVRVKAMAA